MSKASDRESLLALLGPVVAGTGLDLEDVVVTPAGKRRLLRVIVDQDGGVELDVVAAAASAVSQTLDDSNAMGATPYVLEVTSPGVERPLTEPRHWRRALTRLVTVALADGGTLQGRVATVDDAAVTLDVDGTSRRFEWATVTSGRVQVEFNRAGAGATPPAAGAPAYDEEG